MNEMEQLSWQKAEHWANNSYFDLESREEIQKLLDQKQKNEILERFYTDLEFGTGGLRGLLGMGSTRINKYTIRKAVQALCLVLKQSFPHIPRPKVTVSYDSRQFSRELAEEACGVLAANGVLAFHFDHLNPVPLLSFSVRHLKAQAGLMITASHNPIEYNGLKVYWSDGCQVTPPHDQKIITAYKSLTDFNGIKYLPFAEGRAKGLIFSIGKEVEDAYFQVLREKSLQFDLCQKRGKELKIIYTPLHGTGGVPCSRVLTELGLTQYKLVPEQAQPHPLFPSLTTPPNPEIPEALKMATDLMKKDGADLALGTDPDSDRLGVAVSHKGEIHYLNGNQLGVLLLHYILSERAAQGTIPAKALVVKTIVTTELITTLCQHYKVHLENTLTGFKWMCGLLGEWENQGRDFDFLFACEESFGYLTHDQIRDKDGVAALGLVCEMSLWYKTQKMTLMDALDKIYESFGFSHETLVSLNYQGKEGSEKIARIMESFRTGLPTTLCGEKILTLEDYQLQEKKSLQTQETHSLDLPPSNVIGLTLESGNKIYLRPSGTEPKIKFYIMIQEREGDLATKKSKAMAKSSLYEQYLRNRAERA